MNMFMKVWFAVLPALTVGQDFTDSNVTYTYTGPETCSKDTSMKGYSDLSVLSADMYAEAFKVHIEGKEEEKEYVYRLCPETTYDMDSADLSKTIMPLLNNTSIECGKDGSSSNECFLISGQVQVILSIGIFLKNIRFKGLKFSENYGVSVGAWAFPTSDATFEDCIWNFNSGATAIEMYYEPVMPSGRKLLVSPEHRREKYDDMLKNVHTRRMQGYPSMAITLKNCRFSSNDMSQSVILDGGGDLKVIQSDFIQNKVGVFTIGALFGSKLYLEEGTKFTDNDSPAFTVFVDNDSSLEINESTSGNGGTAQVCADGIFIENDAAYCLYQGGVCHGNCCNFGNNTCDVFMSDKELQEAKVDQDVEFNQGQSNAATDSGKKSKKCGGGCLAAAIVVPIAVVSILVVAVLLMKRKKDRVQLGNQPVNTIS